jgi:hypothetical protein
MFSIAEPPHAPAAACETIYVMDQATFCRLRIWSETEWTALPAACRPATVVHVPGLGWVGTEPIVIVN